jgi:HTH-type transcriptional regulator/antitoxin HigA
MTVRPIRNDEDHTAAMAEIARLWNAEPGTPAHDELEIIGTLVSQYEDTRWPLDAGDPVDAIRFRMEQAGLTQTDLARTIGSQSRASEILRRKRHLTIEMIWTLHRDWKIPAESLIRPYDLDAA